MSASHPKAFISYSHADRETAAKIAKSLRDGGIDVWFDMWEILPGDSLIQKIFEEGLSRVDAFIVLLSQDSISSRWVQQELDTALIKRIEGITRVIPVRIADVEVPNALKPLRWIDLTRGFDEGIRELQMAIFQVHERPPVGTPPEFVKANQISVRGLSRLASELGLLLINTGREDYGTEETWPEAQIAEKLGFSPEEADDAIDELESLGLIKTYDYLGTAPYSHGEIEPTYALFLHFKDYGLKYDPEADIKIVAATVVSQKEARGKTIQDLTGLSPLRINRAVDYLEDYGLVKVIRTMGTGQFNFNTVYATGSTRRFVAENS